MFEFAGTAFVLAKEVYGYFKDAKEVYDSGKGMLDAAEDIKEHFEVKEGDAKVVAEAIPAARATLAQGSNWQSRPLAVVRLA